MAALDPRETTPPGVLGGQNHRILPGLIDIQINGAFGHDFSDPVANLEEVCRRLPGYGVTAFVPGRSCYLRPRTIG